MKEKIIIGRYIARDSWIHRLDPRAKMGAMPLFMLAVFFIDSYLKVICVLLFALAVMQTTQIPFRYYIKAVKPLLFLLLFIFIFHVLFDSAGKRLIDVGPFAIYSGGLAKGVISASRMTLFIAFAALLTFTTQPDRLTQGLGSLLAPLRLVGISTDKLVLMLRVSLRFIPTIFEEAHRLYKSQISRGLNLQEHSLLKKARLMITLLVPVTAGVFRRAVSLADSMEARGYRMGAPRTLFREFTWKYGETVFLLSFSIPIIAVLLL